MNNNSVSLTKTWNSLKLFEKLSIILIMFLAATVAIFMIFGRQPVKTRSRASAPKLSPAPQTNVKEIQLNEILTDKGLYMPQDATVAAVGNELIYNRDLNFIVYTLMPHQLKKTTISADELKNRAKNIAIEQSTILQLGQEKGLATLTPSIFNDINKNYNLRLKTVRNIGDTLKKSEEKVSGAFISVWYNNMKPKGTATEEMRKKAWAKIVEIRKEIKSLTASGMLLKDAFAKVGKELKAKAEKKEDLVLLELDPTSAAGNIYGEFNNKSRSDNIFARGTMEKILWKLKANTMSNIIQIPYIDAPVNTSDEEFYAIVAVFEKTNTQQTNFREMITNKRKKINIKNL